MKQLRNNMSIGCDHWARVEVLRLKPTSRRNGMGKVLEEEDNEAGTMVAGGERHLIVKVTRPAIQEVVWWFSTVYEPKMKMKARHPKYLPILAQNCTDTQIIRLKGFAESLCNMIAWILHSARICPGGRSTAQHQPVPELQSARASTISLKKACASQEIIWQRRRDGEMLSPYETALPVVTQGLTDPTLTPTHFLWPNNGTMFLTFSSLFATTVLLSQPGSGSLQEGGEDKGKQSGLGAFPRVLTQKRHGGPGSSPPSCRSKCDKCSPCEPVHVPIQRGWRMPLEYYPEAWRCKCGNKLFMP
ncbi:hypothetical protein D5086_019626 [Populus alba]|uniref:Uncharacterized protein n=1 Tax=Populus alba TaxID=43335 RepID=A0ACC4BJ41_POPAL